MTETERERARIRNITKRKGSQSTSSSTTTTIVVTAQRMTLSICEFRWHVRSEQKPLAADKTRELKNAWVARGIRCVTAATVNRILNFFFCSSVGRNHGKSLYELNKPETNLMSRKWQQHTLTGSNENRREEHHKRWLPPCRIVSIQFFGFTFPYSSPAVIIIQFSFRTYSRGPISVPESRIAESDCNAWCSYPLAISRIPILGWITIYFIGVESNGIRILQ